MDVKKKRGRTPNFTDNEIKSTYFKIVLGLESDREQEDCRCHYCPKSGRITTTYRITTTARFVLDKIENDIKAPSDRNNAISPDVRFLLTLRYYATGSMMNAMADFAGVSAASATRIIRLVSTAVAGLRSQFIRFPEDFGRLNQRFFNVTKCPKVVGAIDCTHVRIQSPGGNKAEVFRNRKGYFSLNVQTIPGPDLEIMDIVARWPGSAHDQTIFNSSLIKTRLERGEFGDCYLVGDSGYTNTNYVVTPLMELRSEVDEIYDESIIRTRNCVEWRGNKEFGNVCSPYFRLA